MGIFRNKRREADGEIVIDATLEHRCVPPSARDWPAGEWKVLDTNKYPQGTVWRCPCGLAWMSSAYDPGRVSGMGLWLNWYRMPKHDRVESES